jgi:hypothetical protein
MPNGKPSGIACVHLDEDMNCALFGDPRRPALCAAFAAEPDLCGETREEALALLASLESESAPAEPLRWIVR